MTAKNLNSTVNSVTHPTRVLVHVTGDRVGDALLKWPAIAAFKAARPNWHLTWMAGRRTSAYAGPLAWLASSAIDEVIERAEVGISWRELRRPRRRLQFDIVIATEPKVRDALLVKRIQHRVFISPAAGFFLSDRRLARGRGYPRSVCEQIRSLLELAAGQALKLRPEITLSPEVQQRAVAELAPGPTYVGLAPGAGGVRKRWPLDRFIEVAQAQRTAGRVPVFFLGPEEKDMLEPIKSELPGALTPELDDRGRARGDLQWTIALAGLCAVNLANDAGSGHLLAASGRPLVSLYGHTDAEKFKPVYGVHIPLRASEYGGREIERIPTARVLSEIDAVLNAGPGP